MTDWLTNERRLEQLAIDDARACVGFRASAPLSLSLWAEERASQMGWFRGRSIYRRCLGNNSELFSSLANGPEAISFPLNLNKLIHCQNIEYEPNECAEVNLIIQRLIGQKGVA